MKSKLVEIPDYGLTPVLIASPSDPLPPEFSHFSGYAHEVAHEGVLIWSFLPGDFDVEINESSAKARFATCRKEPLTSEYFDVDPTWCEALSEARRLILLDFVKPVTVLPEWNEILGLIGQGLCTGFGLHLRV